LKKVFKKTLSKKKKKMQTNNTPRILKKKGIFLIKKIKNSDSRKSKFLFEEKDKDVNQVSLPKPTNKSLKKKPKKILKKLKQKSGMNIKMGES
jgi:hypothetical protein